MELNDEILTIHELAERLKVKRSTIYELTRHRGRVRSETRPLPCIKVGRQLRFNWRLVCRWLTELEEARDKEYPPRRSR
jgi:excisionase family DNA binding protein